MTSSAIMQDISHLPKQFAFAKDLAGKYLCASESFAEAAGADSPRQMVGLKDDDFIWKAYAIRYRKDDAEAYQGKTLVIHEPMLFTKEPKKPHSVITTKTPLRNTAGQIVGVIGSTIEIIGTSATTPLDEPTQINRPFGKRELEVLKAVYQGLTAKETARSLNLSCRTVESYLQNIKTKLQLFKKTELVRFCIEQRLF